MSHPHGAGKSSFSLVESDRLFNELSLPPDITMLDLGCGRGEYSLAAAGHIGPNGLIYAVDLWPEGIDLLQRSASEKGMDQIQALVADAGKPLPIEDNTVDICFMASVFHDFVHDGVDKGALAETVRTLRKGGSLAIVEFKKIDGPPGPPRSIRLSPDELDHMILPAGFEKVKEAEVGPYHYLSVFRLAS